MTMTSLTLVVAATRNNGIGRNGALPWRLPQEMKYFARVTTEAPEGYINATIMGRKTWESIPQRFRPLRNRINIVISHNQNYQVPSLDTAPTYLRPNLTSALDGIMEVTASGKSMYRWFVIGGASLYRESFALPRSSNPNSAEFSVDRVLLTRILSPPFEDCDVFMPDFLSEGVATENAENHWTKATHEGLRDWVGFDVPAGVQSENGVEYEFQMWTRDGAS